MLHACVERFDVTDTVGKILGTKRVLSEDEISKLALRLAIRRSSRFTCVFSFPNGDSYSSCQECF